MGMAMRRGRGDRINRVTRHDALYRAQICDAGGGADARRRRPCRAAGAIRRRPRRRRPRPRRRPPRAGDDRRQAGRHDARRPPRLRLPIPKCWRWTARPGWSRSRASATRSTAISASSRRSPRTASAPRDFHNDILLPVIVVISVFVLFLLLWVDLPLPRRAPIRCRRRPRTTRRSKSSGRWSRC